MFRLTKLTFLLAFTIAGYNVDIRSFNARAAVKAETTVALKRTRNKRRPGTWSRLLDAEQTDAGPDPPSG